MSRVPSKAFTSSRVLRETRAGEMSPCLKLNVPSPRVVELASLAGASAVWLDNEHVPNDWLDLENQIRAARIYGTDVIVRVSKGAYSDYIKPFEAGANGIMVPHVTSAEEARRIVQQTRCLPLGKRPLDGGNVDGKFCLTDFGDYLRALNTEQFIIIQIESPEAVDVVEEIAAVEGFEYLLFGPGDYSHLIGQPGNISHPEVEAARRKVEAAALRHGKRCMAVGYQADAREMLDRGYSLVCAKSDVRALSEGFEQALAPYLGENSAGGNGSTLYGGRQ